MKKAFTLIEMLVVVGIIAVLASIVLVNIRGATAAADTAKCMSNMRSLFNAVNALAMDTGNYPLAGFCVTANPEMEMSDRELEGWISRDRSGNVVPCYGTGNADDDLFALTNGCNGTDAPGKLWKATDSNASIFYCPTFAKYLSLRRKCKPLFSYALNGIRFGSDLTPVSDGYQNYHGAGKAIYNEPKSIPRPDRTVMFAELPIYQSCSYDPLANVDTCNASLQIHKNGRYSGGWPWGGRSEEIGFVHQDKRKKYFGHVVFVDGHVEKFMQPPASSPVKADALTAYICNGDDVAFDEKGYRLVAEVEDEEE